MFVHARDEQLRETADDVAGRLHAESVDAGEMDAGRLEEELRNELDVLLIEPVAEENTARFCHAARRAGATVLIACGDPQQCRVELLARASDWFVLPIENRELELRVQTAVQRASGETLPEESAEAANLLRYQEMLYDRRTGFPTLPVMVERARDLLDRRGELTILYLHFVRYSKIEELYGWQKLDAVLESTGRAVRKFYDRERAVSDNQFMVAYVSDDNFILFTQLSTPPERAEHRLRSLSNRLEEFQRERLEEEHGEDIASLFEIYVGTATIFRNPKVRTERLIYRGVREAIRAARSAEEWERTRKISDLKATIRDGAVFMEYHPIIVTETENVYGYEALARGSRRELRSPEVLLEVAEEADLTWELSRLLRRRAIEGIIDDLGPDQYLFLNVDPHDFNDPAFRDLDPADLGIPDPSRIVLEITERTAIKDYPQFQGYLAAFRDLGFRLAVDDAGSGYAGLGSIAHLDPDYIKLDMSLITGIDSNFLKQNLVETLVGFAEEHGAKVIAEGVERREEFEAVRKIGVHLTQGFLFHRPKFAGAA